MKFFDGEIKECQRPSRPARGAWVEIHRLHPLSINGSVAPRKGRVG